MPDYEAMSRVAADLIEAQVQVKPNSVLGLATGSTPLGTYQELTRRHQEGRLDFSKVITFNLDEYVGLPATHEQSYHYFMHHHLFDHINVPPEHVYIPSGTVHDFTRHCEWYEAQIRDVGGIDLQLLGIGGDGHVAFNEPGSSLGSRTRLKTLTEQTVQDNARFFETEEEVPRFAITMGVGTILEARRIVLVASGEAKAEPIARCIEGPVTAQVTASALQLHRDVVIVIDEAAASQLQHADYYRWVYAQKSRIAEIEKRY